MKGSSNDAVSARVPSRIGRFRIWENDVGPSPGVSLLPIQCGVAFGGSHSVSRSSGEGPEQRLHVQPFCAASR